MISYTIPLLGGARGGSLIHEDRKLNY